MDAQTIPFPSRAHVNDHLYKLFAPEFVQDHPDAWIEIAYADSNSGWQPDEAVHFPPFDLKKVADFALEKNKEGFNIYVGPALRQGETGRAAEQPMRTLPRLHMPGPTPTLRGVSIASTTS